MNDDLSLLLTDALNAIESGGKLAILGFGEWSVHLLSLLADAGLTTHVLGLYTDSKVALDRISVRPLPDLADGGYTHVVVCANREKEELLAEALPHILGTPKVIVSGYEHLEFRDQLFHETVSSLLVPSLANGYPNSLIHIYQCLVSAKRQELKGVVAEFGMFKGGTTMFIARVIRQIKANWRVYGFDTFDGFPPRRSPLDMYEHPDCVFRDQEAVQTMLQEEDVEVVPGDIVTTCEVLDDKDIVLAFVDTDNFTPADALVRICKDRIVRGGAFIFDHYTGVDRFRYTLGERWAAKELVDDPRYLNLHGTGVFLRLS